LRRLPAAIGATGIICVPVASSSTPPAPAPVRA
jgi:hypothetical protein